VTTGLSVAIVLQIWNATALQQSWPHLVMLLWSLFVSMLIFVRFVMVSWREGPGD